MSLEIPNTTNPNVARMAVAWNIVASAGFTLTGSGYLEPKDKVKAMTDAYIQVYNDLQKNEWDLHSDATSEGGFSE